MQQSGHDVLVTDYKGLKNGNYKNNQTLEDCY